MPEITNKATIRDAAVSDHQRIADIYGYHVLNGLASFEESPSDVAPLVRLIKFYYINSKISWSTSPKYLQFVLFINAIDPIVSGINKNLIVLLIFFFKK